MKIQTLVFVVAFLPLALTTAQTSAINLENKSAMELFQGAKICVDDIAVQTGASFTAFDYGQVNEGDCTTNLTPGGGGTITLPVELTDIDALPDVFTLNPAYPNPINPSTTIHYGIPDAREVSIMIYDLAGRRVATLFHDEQQAGWYELTWNGVVNNGEIAPAGMYLYKLIAGDEIKTSKITLIK